MEKQPIFNVDRSVVGLLAVLLAVHVVRQFLPADWDFQLLIHLGLIPARYSGQYADAPGGMTAGITSLVTHMLLHGGWAHLVLNGAWLLAFGGAIARRMGGARFLLLFVLSGLAGALFYLMLHWGEIALLVGASGGISGLFGACVRFIIPMLRQRGFDPQRAATTPAMPIAALLRDPVGLLVIGVWMLLNAGFGLLGDPTGGGMAIAWEAHLGGFLFGLLAFGWFDRPLPVSAAPDDTT